MEHSRKDGPTGRFEITVGGLDDLAPIVELEQRCFPDPWPVTLIQEHLARRAPSSVVARDCAGHLIGYALFVCAADEAELHSLAIDPNHRRQGIAGALIDAVAVRAEHQGVRTVWLEVRRGNTAALALYRSYGFVERAVRKGYYGDGEDAVVLSFSLSRS